MKQPTATHANEFFETTMTNYDSTLPIEVIATIEEELQEQGTSILEVLQSQRDSYLEELSNALSDEQKIIAAIIETIDKAIVNFQGNSLLLKKNSGFNANRNSNYMFYISPDCTCTAANLLLDSPCTNCILFQNTSMSVTAIAVGFEARGWSLAADLMWFNMSNNTIDIDYWPSRGNQIAQAPQISNDLAQSNQLVDSFSQESPGRLNGLFESTIEGDTYNSLGAFWYSKTDAGNGNINVSIIDRYDWAYSEDGGSANVFNDTLALAQEIGIVTPFYTRINLTMPGYVPFNWEYTSDGVNYRGSK